VHEFIRRPDERVELGFALPLAAPRCPVKFLNTKKGFGFIQPAGGDKDVFVYISAIERARMSTLNEGRKVSYDVVSGRGKLAAASLQAV
jgi:cold shock protein